MGDQIWIGMVDVRAPRGSDALDGAETAYTYAAARAPSAIAALQAIADLAAQRQLALDEVDSFGRHAGLSDEDRASEPIATVVAALDDAPAAFAEPFHPYPEDAGSTAVEEAREDIHDLVDTWIDGASEHYGDEFTLGDVALIFEIRFDDGSGSVVGRVLRGDLDECATLLERAAGEVRADADATLS